ncbi:MAG TPA: GAF domain-containing sensor histidine kinase [Flavobacteriaceae bacterium]|nr:GAF domain-containing sensor histidine kinase [Flavobacteriaceae bacterium]
MIAKTRDSEKQRLNALKRYGILDSPAESVFDEFTKLAANILNVPIALISLVDSNRFWFKSKYGVDADQVEFHPSLCASAIRSNGFYEIQDAENDPRANTSPLVTGELGLRFYAAYPLKSREGYNLGTLCVIDKKPRKFTQAEKETLRSLRNLVMDQIELRFLAKETYMHHNRMLGIFAHDLKNPLATINMASDIIQKKKNNPEVVANMCKHIKKSSKNSLRIINELLASSELESGEFKMKFSKFNVGEFLKEIVENHLVPARRKGQSLKLCAENNIEIEADKGKLEEIADNLISNAIKFSPVKKQIKIDLHQNNGNVILQVKDEGPGFNKSEKKKLFKRFSKLKAQPTGGEMSTGLGLFVAKCLVEAHNGSISAESDGKNKGATFTVELPIERATSDKKKEVKVEDVLQSLKN